ncbi:MAG TPA: prephenate dehydratase, partial [Thalassospira sp.]|nr:prephenate dehydratase [Thalassospira sp.]
VADRGDKSIAAIAPALAAEIYGLDVLRTEVEDAAHNTTRFIILAREPLDIPNDGTPVVTSFVFRVRNVAAALYKALGGFAT